MLVFSACLRTHPPAIEAESQIKNTLARLCLDQADAYCDVKDPILDVILEAAED